MVQRISAQGIWFSLLAREQALHFESLANRATSERANKQQATRGLLLSSTTRAWFLAVPLTCLKQSLLLWFSHDVTKMQTKKLSILPRFYFQDALEQLKTNFHTHFRFKRILGFVRRGIYMTAKRAVM